MPLRCVVCRVIMTSSPPPPPVLLHPKVVLSTIQDILTPLHLQLKGLLLFSYHPQSADYPRPVPCVNPGDGPTISPSTFIRR